MISTPTTPSAALRIALALVAGLLVPTAASVHALGADCTLRDGRVVVEAYYSDNTVARDAAVRVLDAAGAVVAEGQTDERGFWSFAAPPPARYSIEVDAGAGHRTRVRLTVPPGSQAAASSSSSPEVTCDCCEDGDATNAAAPLLISEGPSRQEFTATPWVKVGLGLGILAALSVGARFALRRRSPPSLEQTAHPL